MKCNVCQSDLAQKECDFCGESSEKTFFRYKEIKTPFVPGLKDRLNRWANSVPEHNLKNLGESVTFTKVQSMPAHGCGVITRYETRTLSYRYFAGNAKRTKNRTVDMDQIDPWSFRVDFQGKREQHLILSQMETIMTIDCQQCNAGKNACGDCKGDGDQGCYECRTNGVVNCGRCNGHKTVRKGDYDVDCIACGATGEVTCRPCQGTGLVKCMNCRGTGEVNCNNCEGNGVLDEKIMLSAVQHTKEDYLFEKGQHTPEAGKYYDENPGKGVLLLRVENSPLPPDADTLLPFPELRKQIDETLESHDTVPENARIMERSIFIERKPLIQVDYSFKDKGYRFFLVNSDFELKDVNSPIKEYSGELARKSAEMLFSTDLAEVKKGIETLEKSFRVGQELKVSQNQYLKFRKYLAETLLDSAEAESDWTKGMELLVFREKILQGEDEELSTYGAKKIRPVFLLESGLLVLGAVAFVFYVSNTVPKAFITSEISLMFGFSALVLGGISLITSYNMMTHIESRAYNVIKFIVSLLVTFFLLHAAIESSSWLAVMFALVTAFGIPLISKNIKKPNIEDFSETLTAEERKAIFNFLDQNWKHLRIKGK